jgi:hypothetical protein
MAKETFYFSHDYNSRTDSKVKSLLKKFGMVGYGIYWSVIEDLYNNANALPTHYDSIAYDLRTQPDKVKSIINDFGLFVIDGETFGSLSVQRRLDERNEKSKKASDNARKRWDKDANAMPSHSDRNAIKESKVKEKKIKESKVGLIYPYTSKEFMEAWNLLLTTKKWSGKSEQALKTALKKLSTVTEAGAIATIEDTISGEYQGIFPKEVFIHKGNVMPKQTLATDTELEESWS